MTTSEKVPTSEEMTTDEAIDTLVKCWMMEDVIKVLRKVAYETLEQERDKKPKLSLVGECAAK